MFFFDVVLVSNYRFSVKLSFTVLYDRYYLENCKATTFEKVANHTRYEKPNSPSHLYIF